MSEWREGRFGALMMGARHGLFCIGCCWALMLVLFAVGVMNMLWVLLIAVFVLLEKILSVTRLIRAGSGLVLLVWGTYWLLSSSA
jgi:predicted metal-binding membrane protein